jgi:IS5 family transposase
MTKTTGIIVGAVRFKENIYDGHTLPKLLSQLKILVGRAPKVAICDRGFKELESLQTTQRN